MLNIFLNISRILFGLILIISFSICYIACLTLLLTLLLQISIWFLSISIVFYDIIKSLVLIMILGIYDE